MAATVTWEGLRDLATFRASNGCAISVYLKDKEAALEMLRSVFETVTESFMPYLKADPDLQLLHGEPRYQAMLAAAEARLALSTHATAAHA